METNELKSLIEEKKWERIKEAQQNDEIVINDGRMYTKQDYLDLKRNEEEQQYFDMIQLVMKIFLCKWRPQVERFV